MSHTTIPMPVIVVISDILASRHTHNELNTIFFLNGASGEEPDGSKINKCRTWLSRCNNDPEVDAFKVLGKVIEELMEVDKFDSFGNTVEEHVVARQKVNEILSKHGLSYHTGGQILGATAGLSTKTLKDILKSKDLRGVEQEFQRAISTIESDPPAGLTAACSIVESLCKIYIEDEGLILPSDQTIKPLWKVVSSHLGFEPGQLVDDDLKKILSGLFTTVDGLGALRTHAGSAHGRGRKIYNIKARHARLAAHAAHTLCVFIIETWADNKIK